MSWALREVGDALPQGAILVLVSLDFHLKRCHIELLLCSDDAVLSLPMDAPMVRQCDLTEGSTLIVY